MANLLPLAQKQKIRKEYKMRRASVMFVLIIFLFVIGIVLLIPQHVALSIKQTITTEELESIKNQISQKTSIDPEEIIKQTNSQIGLLVQSPQAFAGIYNTFYKIIEKRSNDIAITGMFYNLDNNEMKISIHGIARNRKSLSEFAEILESQKIFFHVELPISNFVKEEDIDFSLTLKINTENVN